MDASIKLIKKLKLLGMNIDNKLNYINDINDSLLFMNSK